MACVAAMLMIDAGATFVALFVAGLVYHAVQRRQLRARWGDVRYGALVLGARLVLEALSRRRLDARSWNPNVLVLTGTPSSRWHLVVIGRALASDSGLLMVAMVVPDGDARRGDRIDAIRRTIEEYLQSHRVSALVKVESDVLGLRPIGDDETLEEYAAYYASLSRQTEGLPPTALVNAGEEVDLHRLFAGR